MVRLYCLLIGYVCGLFQTAYLIGRYHHTDIRKHGSGNAGSTNALRTFGKTAGLLTLICDCLKCVAALLIVKGLFGGSHGEILPLLCIYAGAGCILGHNFPFYLNFRGGKGIAASLGMVLAFDPRVGLLAAVIFLAVFFATHYVSLGSILAYIGGITAIIVLGQTGAYHMEKGPLHEMYAVALFLLFLAVFRHRANIGRLIHGTESRIYLKKTK